MGFDQHSRSSSLGGHPGRILHLVNLRIASKGRRPGHRRRLHSPGLRERGRKLSLLERRRPAVAGSQPGLRCDNDKQSRVPVAGRSRAWHPHRRNHCRGDEQCSRRGLAGIRTRTDYLQSAGRGRERGRCHDIGRDHGRGGRRRAGGFAQSWGRRLFPILQDAVDYAWSKIPWWSRLPVTQTTARCSFPPTRTTRWESRRRTRNNKASFSNFGPSVDIAAPGLGVLSTFPTYLGTHIGYATLSGTSMATPHVAALAGLVATTTPGIATQGITQRIQQSAASTTSGGGWTATLGYGVIDAFGALSGASRPATTGSVVGQLVDSTHIPVAGTITVGVNTVTVDSTGLFRVSGLAPGTYTLSATGAPGTQSLSVAVVRRRGHHRHRAARRLLGSHHRTGTHRFRRHSGRRRCPGHLRRCCERGRRERCKRTIFAVDPARHI